MTDSVPDFWELVEVHDRQFQKAAIDQRIYFFPVDEVRLLAFFVFFMSPNGCSMNGHGTIRRKRKVDTK